MKKTETINFKIESLDSLCQGVSRSGDQIVFLPKVLVGETGSAKIYASKKNVNFATLESLDTTNDQRIDPVCPHFSKCGGCQLLHVPYSEELKFKHSSIVDIFKRQHKIDISDVLTQIAAPRRDFYRNRIQLQYDKAQGRLGFLSDNNKEIIEISKCSIALPEILEEVKKLYENGNWIKEARLSRGHLEIYKKDDKITKTWDSRYANEGFSQVFDEMNEELLSILTSNTEHIRPETHTTIDLFGGNGNLTKHLKTQTIVIDSTPKKYINLQSKMQNYQELDIYSKEAPTLLSRSLKDTQKKRFLMVDPPRSGLKNLREYCDIINPESIIYVSCNPQTLARDLNLVLEKFTLKKIIQLDFFPGTKHYETVAFLEKNN